MTWANSVVLICTNCKSIAHCLHHLGKAKLCRKCFDEGKVLLGSWEVTEMDALVS